MVFCHGIKSHFCIKQCSFHFVITIPFWLIHSFPAICMTGWDQHSSISLQTSGQERWNKLGLSSIGLCLIVMRWIVYCYILSNHIWLPEFLYSKYLFYLNLSLPLFFHLLILSVTLFIYLFIFYLHFVRYIFRFSFMFLFLHRVDIIFRWSRTVQHQFYVWDVFRFLLKRIQNSSN